MSDLVEQCRDAFDSDNPAYKNLALRKCAARIERLERELAAAKEALERLYHEVEGMPFRNHAGALVSWKRETQGKIIAALGDGGDHAD